MGSGVSYKNLLQVLSLVVFALILLHSKEATGQASLQNKSPQDTTRKSFLKLNDVSGIPWESMQRSPLYLGAVRERGGGGGAHVERNDLKIGSIG